MIEVLVQCECGGEVRGLFARYSDIDKPAGWEDWGGRQTCPDCLPKRDADPEREAQEGKPMKTLDAKGENLQPKIDDMVETLRGIADNPLYAERVAAACLRRLGIEP